MVSEMQKNCLSFAGRQICQSQRLCVSVKSSKERQQAKKRTVVWQKAYEIMQQSARTPVNTPGRSMGGLIGGEAKRLSEHQKSGKSMCGSLLGKAMMYAMAVLETNSSMGLIVAAPTAGSAGIVPGLMIAMQEEYGFTDEQMIQALYNAGAIGYLAMRNATVAGAVGGCQAEVGVWHSMQHRPQQSCWERLLRVVWMRHPQFL